MAPRDDIPGFIAPVAHGINDQNLTHMRDLERQVRWLASWTIHHANHIRPKTDDLKVGGHQASCASAVTLMTTSLSTKAHNTGKTALK